MTTFFWGDEKKSDTSRKVNARKLKAKQNLGKRAGFLKHRIWEVDFEPPSIHQRI